MADIQFPGLYVRWKVNSSGKKDTVLRSDAFRFQNEEVYLRYERHGRLNYLFLVYESGPYTPFKLAVHVESERTGNILPDLSIKKHLEETVGNDCVWKKYEEEIARVIPEYNWKYDLSLLVILKADDILTDTRWTDTRSKNTQTVWKLPKDERPSTSVQTECMLENTSVQTQLCMSMLPCLDSLSDDFSKLLSKGEDPDVEIQCGSVTSKAHKLILCARSPVFQSMLNTDMVEGQTGVLKIDDVDAEVLNQFVTYIYTGAVDALTFDSAMGLYEAGDKYSVLTLARLCSEFLKEHLTVENVCDVYIVADAHSDANFVETVIAFILDNKDLLRTDRWSVFCEERPRLANKVFNKLFKLMPI